MTDFGQSTPAGRGFSRPRPAAGDPPRWRVEAGALPESSPRGRDWLLLELRTLALDFERARSYLARPGCNVLLGLAQLSRTMAKRSRLLGLLREGRCPVDPFGGKGGGTRRWSPRGGRS